MRNHRAMLAPNAVPLLAAILMLAGCGEGGNQAPAPDPGDAGDAPALSGEAPTDAAEPGPGDAPASPASAQADDTVEARPEGAFDKPVEILEHEVLRRFEEDSIGVRHIHETAGLLYYIPGGWIPETQLANPPRLNQVRIFNNLADDDDAIFAVFGGIGGSVDANLARWVRQMIEVEFAPMIRTLSFADGTPLQITEVLAVGTYDSGLPSSPGPKENTMFLGAIIEGGPEGTVYFRLTGPRELVEMNQMKWLQLLRSVRIPEAPPEVRNAERGASP